ncbi:hypothetical protein BU24DRAFT_462113 [Aaosphaeria arxii CBS 175.79]|uniref:Ubiquitin-like-conjugating enzyme ATG10 n=1 Tax=Aaosphaeria arxii CBS 175.79 TaxID=1450172 RepID=A0A6A5XT43_9PLEO|nr:uncharacterized protein BU24DRAFT_462113 [Aaosphaeria arxii CBS 175.79]KAF2015891.1 hypothetical protein BU24DRAFT_462113 [Aaosphaeria arxii CBS 175.79]
MTNRISQFPVLTTDEFKIASATLSRRFEQLNSSQSTWLSVNVLREEQCTFLQILKARPDLNESTTNIHGSAEPLPIEDDDEEEVLQNVRPSSVVITYDVLLSPSYQVPMLYISFIDAQHRYPPTMETLYRYLIPRQFTEQINSVGIIGGITITDHPLTGSPVFFIHPCQTAAVMEASVGNKELTPVEYLMVWIGAMGGCVGLNIPIALAQNDDTPCSE